MNPLINIDRGSLRPSRLPSTCQLSGATYGPAWPFGDRVPQLGCLPMGYHEDPGVTLRRQTPAYSVQTSSTLPTSLHAGHLSSHPTQTRTNGSSFYPTECPPDTTRHDQRTLISDLKFSFFSLKTLARPTRETSRTTSTATLAAGGCTLTTTEPPPLQSAVVITETILQQNIRQLQLCGD